MYPYTPPASAIPMPTTKPSRQWGIRMSGCGEVLEKLIGDHLSLDQYKNDPSHVYTLVEIGSAGCVSLRAFNDILNNNLGDQSRYRAIGFDLPPGQAWSLDLDEVKRSFSGLIENIINYTDNNTQTLPLGMSLMLMENPRRYFQTAFPFNIDFAFIDGSHGKSCALDFLAIEQKIAPGGLVVFHDYGEPEQGTDWQEVDKEFISVRNWVHRLGLAKPCPNNEPRKGWRFVGEIKGSRHWGGDGNSCAVVQRTSEALEYQPNLSTD